MGPVLHSIIILYVHLTFSTPLFVLNNLFEELHVYGYLPIQETLRVTLTVRSFYPPTPSQIETCTVLSKKWIYFINAYFVVKARDLFYLSALCRGFFQA